MSSPSNRPARPRALVIGLGSVDRGDDAVGPAVARLVAALFGVDVGQGRPTGTPADVDVLVHEDPSALIDLMPGWDLVVVVDAMRADVRAGVVRVLRVGAGAPALPVRTGPTGTHDLGLAGVLALAAVLDRLPVALRVVGVQAASFEPGAPLSAAVACAVPRAVDAVLEELAALAGAPVGDRSTLVRPVRDREAVDVR